MWSIALLISPQIGGLSVFSIGACLGWILVEGKELMLLDWKREERMMF